MMTFQALVTLALGAAEPVLEQPADAPSLAMLLYLEEFSGVDEQIVEFAMICKAHSDPQGTREQAVQALVQCAQLPEPSAHLPEPTNIGPNSDE